jgi:phage shock protein PspC (stress-responsive transcriptional regulator)
MTDLPSVPTPDATSGPTSDAHSAQRDRIRRDARNGMVGGVAAGFARHIGVDVVWIRLAFVLLTVFGGGVGIVIYLAAWLIVPDGDESDAQGPARARGRSPAGRGPAFWTGVVLVGVGGVILLDTVLGPLTSRFGWISTGDLVFPLVLIAIGTLIYRSSRDRDIAPSAAPRTERIAADTEPLGTRVEQRVERWGEEVERVAEDWEARIEARAEALREARSRARVAPTTFGAAFITLGGLWLASSLGVPGITPTRALAATLLVIGVGLVIGAFLGRGRGLILAGALLAPVVLVLGLLPQIPGDLRAVSIGEDGVIVSEGERRVERPASLAALPAEYEFGAGALVIDLRGLGDELADAGRVQLTIEMGVGDLRVHLPEGVVADVTVELGIGRLEWPGATRGGLGVSERQTFGESDGSTGLLVIEIEQGIGGVTVTR